MGMFLKKEWVIFIIMLIISGNVFSQNCSVNLFFKSYTGDGFAIGGSHDDRLTILPDSSMIMCNSLFIARIYQNTDVAWSKSYLGYTGKSSNALADYDGGIVCALGNNICKFDTSGNVVYQKKIAFALDNGNDVTNLLSFRDIAILEDGDKVVLYEDVTGRYGGYLCRFDKDMTIVKWCKNIRYNNDIYFTNMVVDGSKIILSGLCKEFYYSAPYIFLAAINSGDGSLSRAGYLNCPDLGSLNRLYKGNGQYFLTGNLLNQTDAAGKYFYIRIDSLFNGLSMRRIIGYTDYFGTSYSLAPQNDNSLYGIIGRGIGATIFKIDKQDSINWHKAYLIGGYPHDVKQTAEALFFAADWDYNAVGVGAKSTFTICKTDYNGNILNNCMTQLSSIFETNNYNFSPVTPSVLLQATGKLCKITTGNSTFSNYVLDPFGCSYNSVCDSISLIGDTAVCNRLPVHFTGRRNSTCNNPVSWSVYPAADFTILNDSTISVNFINSGNYKVISKINDRCYEYNDSINVHVNLSRLMDIPGDSILCAGNTIKLSAGNQFKNYEWQDGSADSVFIINQTGKFYITVKDYCDNVYSDTINITPANFYFSLGNDTVKCNADRLMLKATTGFSNYQWPLQYNLETVDDSTVIVNPHTDTMYIATAEKMPGCFVKDSIYVTVFHSLPVLLGNDTSLCTGQSLLLDAGNNFSLYNWSTGDVSNTITVNNTGTYILKATAANGCSSEDTLKILNITPAPSFKLGNDTTLCQGQKLSFNFNLTNAAYLWNNGSILDNEKIQTPGKYWLKVIQQGCSAIDTINVFYKPSPVVHLGQDTVLCDGIIKQLKAFNNDATYMWQDGSNKASYIVTTTGLYSVLVEISGCKTNDSVSVTYKSKPVIGLVKDTFICKGQEIILNPRAASGDNYLWQDGSSNISLKLKEPGIYTLIASNECGITKNTVNVNLGTCELYMPTAFTPDNNGINDVFRVKNIFAVKDFSFIIYNRFGEIVFESNSINIGWDGLYKGTTQNAGAYIWMISYIGSNNIKKIAKGTVLLIR